MVASVCGCRSDRNVYADAFAPDRLRTLERSVIAAQESVKVAASELAAGNLEMVRLFEEPDRDEAFVAARRITARARGRLTAMDNRLKNVENNARDLLEEWSRETRSFKNSGLKAKSRADLLDLKTRWEPLSIMLANTRAAFPPVLVIMDDDVLSLKHRRTALAPALPSPTPGRYEQSISEVQRWAGLCDSACNEFTAMLPRGEEPR